MTKVSIKKPFDYKRYYTKATLPYWIKILCKKKGYPPVDWSGEATRVLYLASEICKFEKKKVKKE